MVVEELIINLEAGDVFGEDCSVIKSALGERNFNIGKKFYHANSNGLVTDLEIVDIKEWKVHLKIIRHRKGSSCPAYGEGIGWNNLCGYTERPCNNEEGFGAEHCGIYRFNVHF